MKWGLKAKDTALVTQRWTLQQEQQQISNGWLIQRLLSSPLREPRKMTGQGIANIQMAHLEQAKRMANIDPVPVKRVRKRVMRKAEIIRMT